MDDCFLVQPYTKIEEKSSSEVYFMTGEVLAKIIFPINVLIV